MVIKRQKHELVGCRSVCRAAQDAFQPRWHGNQMAWTYSGQREHTKGTDRIKSIRVLHAVKLHAIPVPLIQQTGLSSLLFGAPRHVVYDLGDLPPASVRDQVDRVIGLDSLEQWEEERVRVGCLFRRDVLFVEHVVKKRGKFDDE